MRDSSGASYWEYPLKPHLLPYWCDAGSNFQSPLRPSNRPSLMVIRVLSDQPGELPSHTVELVQWKMDPKSNHSNCLCSHEIFVHLFNIYFALPITSVDGILKYDI